MLTSQEYGAIKADLEAGMYRDREEASEMRDMIREYEEFEEYCRGVRAELDYELWKEDRHE